MPRMKGHTKPMTKAISTGPMNSHDHFRMGRFNGAPPWVLHLLFNFRFPFKTLISKNQFALRSTALFSKNALLCKTGAGEIARPQGLVLMKCQRFNQPLTAAYWVAQPSTKAVLTSSQLASD